jgi:hypothetical protein
MKRPFLLALSLLLIGAGCAQAPAAPAPQDAPAAETAPPSEAPTGKRAPATRVEDSIFIVDGEPVTLTAGISEVRPSADSATVIVTRLFGEPVPTDLDGDGDLDAAVFLSRDNGGSGIFYYVAASLNEDGLYRGTTAILMGDRVAPQTLEVRGPLIIANYADRNPGEPMTARPSLGVSKYLRIEDGDLKETTQP